MSSEDLLVSTDSGVRSLTFNRPERFNAVTADMMEAAIAAVDEAADDSSIRLITMTGSGRAFCAGADISGSSGDDDEGSALPDMALVDAVNRFALATRRAPQLVVALVNGVAAGVGSSFVLGADLAIATSSAYLKTGFEAIGLMPDGGGTAYLVASLGRSRAIATAVLGDRITADDALQRGLFARVWSDETYAQESRALVERLASGPSRAYAAVKRAMDARSLPHFADALELERREQGRLLASGDYAAGLEAFAHKTAPRFTGA